MPFKTYVPVRFADVDPAGIVFYPRYFEMLNGAVEDWFAQKLGLSFATMHCEGNMGVPTVSVEATFLHPSKLGERLSINLCPQALGTSSCKLEVLFAVDDQVRLKAEVVLVCMDLLTHKSMAWPAAVRDLIALDLASVLGPGASASHE